MNEFLIISAFIFKVWSISYIISNILEYIILYLWHSYAPLKWTQPEFYREIEEIKQRGRNKSE